MTTDNNSTSFFDKVLLFIGIDVHKAKWVVTIRTYDLELKTFSMKPSAEELEKFLLKNYPGAEFRIVYECLLLRILDIRLLFRERI
ncbi:MAG: hypothetical protein M5U17_06750 [Ignavibacterium sp.]|nr:hypothetical protein [Ignavibacterium sp.]